MEEFINKIFENTKETLLNGVDPKYHDELQEGYRESLNRIFEGLKVKDEFYEEALKKEVDNNIKELSELAADERLSKYLKDDAYFELLNLSNKAFQSGIARANEDKVLDEEEAQKNQDAMTNLLGDIREFNKTHAVNVYIDGMTDFEYACGKSDACSLRLGHYRIEKQSEEKEEKRNK